MISWPWVLWGLAFLISGIALEGLAMRHGTRLNTLSRSIYYLGQNFPLSIWLGGLFTGGLAVHFFWHWCPGGGTGIG